MVSNPKHIFNIPQTATEWERSSLRLDLLKDLLKGFRINASEKPPVNVTAAYADPMRARAIDDDDDFEDDEVLTTTTAEPTTSKGWFRRWFR